MGSLERSGSTAGVGPLTTIVVPGRDISQNKEDSSGFICWGGNTFPLVLHVPRPYVLKIHWQVTQDGE